MNKLSTQNFIRNYSIETTVREAKRVERFAGIVGSGTQKKQKLVNSVTILELSRRRMGHGVLI